MRNSTPQVAHDSLVKPKVQLKRACRQVRLPTVLYLNLSDRNINTYLILAGNERHGLRLEVFGVQEQAKSASRAVVLVPLKNEIQVRRERVLRDNQEVPVGRRGG